MARNGRAQRYDSFSDILVTDLHPSSANELALFCKARYLPDSLRQISNCFSIRRFKQKKSWAVSLLPTKVRIFFPHLHVLNAVVRLEINLEAEHPLIPFKGKQQ